MRLAEVAGLLEAAITPRLRGPCTEVMVAHAGDQMSDVLASSPAGALLITGLTNGQVIRTVEIAGLAAIVFVGGKPIPPETIQAAERSGIPVIRTQLSMFEACGRLHRAGLGASGRRASVSGSTATPR